MVSMLDHDSIVDSILEDRASSISKGTTVAQR